METTAHTEITSSQGLMLINSKRLRKQLSEILFTFIILTGLVGIFFFLWFVDVHTFEIVITRDRHPGPL